MAKPILDDELWALIDPLLPPPKPRRSRYPGRKPLDDRAVPRSLHENRMLHHLLETTENVILLRPVKRLCALQALSITVSLSRWRQADAGPRASLQ